MTCVPAAERVESVHGRDPKLLAWLGARRAGGDGAQAQTLVVTETRLLHQLLHGGLLWGSQGAGGQQLPVVWYWNTSQQIGAFLFFGLDTFFAVLICSYLVPSLEMSSSSCQVIRLPLSFFFRVLWLPRPMVIFPALFAPFTIVLDKVLRGERDNKLISDNHQRPGQCSLRWNRTYLRPVFRSFCFGRMSWGVVCPAAKAKELKMDCG